MRAFRIIVAGLFAVCLGISGALAQSAQPQFLFRVGNLSGGSGGMVMSGPNLVQGHVETELNDTWAVTGGSGTITWTLSQEPVGLSFQPDAAQGEISGQPQAAGVSNAVLTATDSLGHTVSKQLTFSIGGTLVVSEAQDYCALGGTNVDIQPPQVLGMPAYPLVWTVEAGSLPSALSLDPNSGVISGILGGTSSLRLQVTDATGASALSNSFTICAGQNDLTLSALPSIFGHVGTALSSQQPMVSAGADQAMPPFDFGLESGTLPPGLSVSQTSGVIGGVPTQAGVWGGLALWASDSAGHLGFEVNPFDITIYPPLSIPTAMDQIGRINTPVNFAPPGVANSPIAPVTWFSLLQMPEGLSVDKSGYITGTPVVAGVTQAQLRIVDAQGATADSPQFSITVLPQLQISGVTDITTRVGTAMSGSVPVLSGGPVAPVIWSLQSGSGQGGPSCNPSEQVCWIPSIDPATGVVSAPAQSAPGTQKWNVSASDATGYSAPAIPINVTVLPDLSVAFGSGSGFIVSNGIAQTHAGMAGLSIPIVVGGSPIGAATTSLGGGAVPTGMTFAGGGTPSVSGSPSAAGAYPFSVSISDSGGWSGSSNLEIDVLPAPSADDENIALKTGYSWSMVMPGAPQNCIGGCKGTSGQDSVWTVSGGTFPPGVAFGYDDTGTPYIGGTPTEAGAWQVTLAGSDGLGVAFQMYLNFTVSADFQAVVSPDILNATTGSGLSAQASIQGIATEPVTWSMTGAPDWLTIDPQSGAISGTAQATGNYSGTVSVLDAAGVTRSVSLPIMVKPAAGESGSQCSLVITSSGGNFSKGVLQGVFGSPISPVTFSVAGASGTPSWSLGSGAPGFLSLTPAADGMSAVLAGTGSTLGQWGFNVNVNAATNCGSVGVNFVVSDPSGGGNAAANARVGETFSAAAADLFGVSGDTWSLKSGALPDGISLAGDGTISGTPADVPGGGATGKAAAVLAAVDGSGSETDYDLTIDVYANLSLATVADPQVFYPGGSSQFVLAPPQLFGAMPGRPVVWSLSGTLPAGLIFDADGTQCGTNTPGAICGQPQVGGAAGSGSYAYVVSEAASASSGASLGAGQVQSNSFLLSMSDSFSLSTPQNLVAQLGGQMATAAPLVASGTPDGALSFALQSGSISADPGLIFDPEAGVVKGDPTIAGSYNLVISATDGIGDKAATGSFSIDVWPSLQIAAMSDYNARVGALAATPTPVLSNLPTGIAASFSENGSLPPGMTFDASTGVFSGTPEAAGTYPVTVIASDSLIESNNAPSAAFNIIIAGPLTAAAPVISSDGVGGTWHVGQTNVGTAAPVVTGNPFNPKWSVASGSLPPGMSLQANGAVYGSPTTQGDYTIALEVKDAWGGDSTTPSFTLHILPAMGINTVADQVLRYSVSGQTQGPGVSGDPVAPTSWQLLDGSGNQAAAPAGLTFNATLGTLSGTPSDVEAAPVVESYQLIATDAVGGTAKSNLFSVTINPGFSLQLSAASFDGGTVAYAHVGQTVTIAAPTVSGTAVEPLNWSLAGGSLPLGLSMGSDGSISGQALAIGDLEGIILQAIDSGAESDGGAATAVTPAFKINVVGALAIESVADEELHIGQQFNQTPVVSNPVPGALEWAVASGALPPGVTLGSDGSISGAPTENGVWTAVLSVTDASGTTVQSNQFTITVWPPLGLDAMADAVVHAGWPVDLPPPQVENGFTPFAFSIAPALPVGLSLNAATGEITGTAASGDGIAVAYTLSATDQAGATASTVFHITVLPALSLAAPTGGSWHTGQTVAVAAPGLGGSPVSPVTFALAAGSQALPAGLNVDSSTGVVSGTLSDPVSSVTSYLVSLEATDATGAQAISQSFAIEVYPPLSVIVGTSAPIARVGLPETIQAPAASNVIGTVSYSLADGASLPSGMSVNSSTGAVSGTPAAGTAGTYQINILATDSSGATAQTGAVSLVVFDPLTMAQEVNTNGFGYQPYSLAAPALGNSPQGTVTWSLVAGTLPPGLSVQYDGSIQGTPTTTSGTWSGLQLQAVDAMGATVIGSPFSITISYPELYAPNVYPQSATGQSPYIAASYDGVTGLQFTAAGQTEVLTFAAPVTADSTDAVLGSNLVFEYFDSGSNQWLPVGGTVSSTQYRLRALGAASVSSFRIGYEGHYPAYTASISAAAANVPIGASYTGSLTSLMAAKNISGTANWSVVSGSLPDGLSLGSDGTLSGTVGSEVVTQVTVQVTDASGIPSVPKVLDIDAVMLASQVYPSAISNSGAPVEIAALYDNSTAYQTSIAYQGGYVEFDYPEIVGVDSIDFNPSDSWNGGAPSVVQTQYWNGSAWVVNSGGGAVYATKFRVFNYGGFGESDVISKLRLGYGGVYPDYLPSLPLSNASLAYNQAANTTLDALMSPQNVEGQENWTLISGSAPAGLSISSDGEVTGTPSAKGNYVLTYALSDSRGIASIQQSLTITIGTGTANLYYPTPSMYCSAVALPGGSPAIVSRNTTANSLACNGSEDEIALTYANPTVVSSVYFEGSWTVPWMLYYCPVGVSCSINGSSVSGFVSLGTLANGVTNFSAVTTSEVIILIAGRSAQSEISTFLAGYNGQFPPYLTNIPNQSASFALGQPGSYQIQYSDLHGNGSWALASGTMPAGLSLDPTTGKISGTPTKAGTTVLYFTVTDSQNGLASYYATGSSVYFPQNAAVSITVN